MMMFVFSLGLVRVCEIEISHMGKNNGNPDLVCENIIFFISSKTYGVGTQKNRLNETVPLSTQNTYSN